MSRLLGVKTRKKKLFPHSEPEGEGRLAFYAGLPITANRYGFDFKNEKGKAHSWARGWRRARIASQKKK